LLWDVALLRIDRHTLRHWLALRDKGLLLWELVTHLIRELAWLLRRKLAARWQIVLLLNTRCNVLQNVRRNALRHTLLLHVTLLSYRLARYDTKSTSAGDFAAT
jgi:hypothetical protein